jgi:hypothetical protein
LFRKATGAGFVYRGGWERLATPFRQRQHLHAMPHHIIS